MKRIIPPEVNEEIIKLYKEGYTIYDISLKTSVSKSSVASRIPKELRLGKGNNKTIEERSLDKGKCIALLKAGWDLSDIKVEAEFDLKRELHSDELKWLSDLMQAILDYRLNQLTA